MSRSAIFAASHAIVIPLLPLYAERFGAGPVAVLLVGIREAR